MCQKKAYTPKHLRLRGGTNEDAIPVSKDIFVPTGVPTLHEAVALASDNIGDNIIPNIVIRPGGSTDTYNWGEPNCEHQVLLLNRSAQINAADGVQLYGPIILETNSRGLIHKVAWGWERQASLELRAGFNIM
jgi:hypothetical protein